MNKPLGARMRRISASHSRCSSSGRCEKTDQAKTRLNVSFGSDVGGSLFIPSNRHHLFVLLAVSIAVGQGSIPQIFTGSRSLRKNLVTLPQPHPKSKMASHRSILPAYRS